ncbi:MAG: hypothetical protein ABI864_03050 [Chloroflexota bacterium]
MADLRISLDGGGKADVIGTRYTTNDWYVGVGQWLSHEERIQEAEDADQPPLDLTRHAG